MCDGEQVLEGAPPVLAGNEASSLIVLGRKVVCSHAVALRLREERAGGVEPGGCSGDACAHVPDRVEKAAAVVVARRDAEVDIRPVAGGTGDKGGGGGGASRGRSRLVEWCYAAATMRCALPPVGCCYSSCCPPEALMHHHTPRPQRGSSSSVNNPPPSSLSPCRPAATLTARPSQSRP